MRRKILNTSCLLAVVAFLGLAAVPLLAQAPSDELKDALEAVRRQRAELENKLQVLRQKELALEKDLAAEEKKGYYVRVEIKGRLQKQVVPNLFPVDGENREVVRWTVAAGRHAYTLTWASTSAEEFTKLAKTLDGKDVVVSGLLLSPSEKLPTLAVETFKASAK
jgi:hypothetical protein